METRIDFEGQRTLGAPMVQPGERAVLLSHEEYRRVRALGRGVEEYDLLMREPEDVGEETKALSTGERWIPVAANKYLKHRAHGWREAESAAELPEHWRKQALERDAFPASDDGNGEEA